MKKIIPSSYLSRAYFLKLIPLIFEFLKIGFKFFFRSVELISSIILKSELNKIVAHRAYNNKNPYPAESHKWKYDFNMGKKELKYIKTKYKKCHLRHHMFSKNNSLSSNLLHTVKKRDSSRNDSRKKWKKEIKHREKYIKW